MVDSGIPTIEQKVRKIRKHIVNMIYAAGSGHPGGSMSCVEILSALYFSELRYDPGKPGWEDRDRFILSKGHAAPALFATLAEAGFIPREQLPSLRKQGSILQGHPDRQCPGVEVSSGSLGQGLSIASGMALSSRMRSKSRRIYVLLGDGECDEGQVWEAAMLASHYKLDNLVAIIDRNGLQIDGLTEKVMRLEPLSKKWESFGWNVIEVDGHSIPELTNAFQTAKNLKRKPTVIIAHTFKGKGVSFMEWIGSFHGRSLTKDEMERALEEIQ